jgi:hypothetical protein
MAERMVFYLVENLVLSDNLKVANLVVLLVDAKADMTVVMDMKSVV